MLDFAMHKEIIKHHKAAVFCGLCIIIILLYYPNIINASFVYDDFTSIVNNPAIRNPFDLSSIFNAFNTRFVVGFTFSLNYLLGGLDPFGYRLVNAFIHVFNSYSLYILISLLLGLASNRSDVYKYALAGVAAFFYAVHPLATEPVNFVTQRYVLIASFFYLSAVIAYIKWRTSNDGKQYLLILLCTVCAMFSKEMALTLPIMFMVIEFIFFKAQRRNLFLLVILLLTLIVIPLTLLRTSSHENMTAEIATVNEKEGKVDITRASSVGRLEYFLTQIKVVRSYVRLIFVPVNQNAMYDVPLTKKLDWELVCSALFLVCIFCIALVYLRHDRGISFGILWFFVTLTVESSVIPINHYIAEYRAYLPLAGCLIALTFLLSKVSLDKIRIIIISSIFLLFLILTVLRNQVWSNEISLWKDVVKKSPNVSRAYANLGAALVSNAQYNESLPYLKEALEKSLDGYSYIPSILLTLGNAYSSLGRSELAVYQYTMLYSMMPDNEKPDHILGYFYFKNKLYDKAIEYFKRSILMHGYTVADYYYLAVSYLRCNKLTLAKTVIDEIKIRGDEATADQLLKVYDRMVK
jgi:protein O-mannosyl-transferase